ncbi:MAG: CDP-alcohol phosphatidyltransferase family protein [Gemmatimonadetes bacterium]|nr:CDP-alcohol phosphatidyltransferase family protein [Gemmatimonadota bacterium]
MRSLWDSIVAGYLRVVEPFIGLLVRRRVSPNALTTLGTLCTCTAGIAFGAGHISIGGWVLGITAVFDLADGAVARRTGQSTVFGAFYDSTLDRVADGFLFGGLIFFFAADPWHRSLPMVAVGLLGLISTFTVSYARSRAEALGITMKGVGMMERAERITLLAAPQALFGLALDGLVLRFVLSVLSATALVTAVQRIAHVRWATQPAASPPPTTGSEPVVARLDIDSQSETS